MSIAENVASIVSRIRWKSIIALILLLGAGYAAVSMMQGGYSIGGDVGLRVTANPSKVQPGSSSALDVELRNMDDKKDLTVVVSAQTYDRSLYFEENTAQTYTGQPVKLGPQETRRISLKVKTKPEILQGKYSVDFKATPQGDDKGAENRVFLTVEKS
jgi:hypothetical protein